MSEPLALTLRWRASVSGRTIHVQYGAEPADTDPIIGMMDTPELAAEVAFAHNAILGVRPFQDVQEMWCHDC